MAKSWKTTTAGILAAVGVFAAQLSAVFDNDPTTNANWETIIGAIVAVAGILGLGLVARDNDKTSSQVGAE